MKNKAKTILRLLPMLATMILIFIYSAMPGNESSAASNSVADKIAYAIKSISNYQMSPSAIATLNVIIRKGAHFTEYAILAAAILFAVYGLIKKHRYFISWLVATLYAVSDEIHQLFVPGRSGQPGDVLIDSFGAFTGLLLISLVILLFNKKKEIS